MKKVWTIAIMILLAAGMAVAQEAPAQAPATPDPQSQPTPPPPGQRHIERREVRVMRGPDGEGNVMYRRMGMGQWWKDADLVKELGISDDQVQKIEQIFLDSRLKLVDLKGNLEKEEIRMEPMMQADTPNEQAILAQIDKIAAARAELEKANARMNLGIRRVLTADQWKKLQAKQQEMRPKFFRHFEMPAPPPGGPGGPAAPPAPPNPDED